MTRPADSPDPVSASHLIAMLSEAIGEHKAALAVREQQDALGLGSAMSKEEALMLLEHLAGGEDIVAAVARFAKVRLLLE
ncbi:MAG: hypothetical protein AAGF12_39680 [Myxococcota bacterium]